MPAAEDQDANREPPYGESGPGHTPPHEGDRDPEEPQGPPSSVLGSRLAPGTDEEPPTWKELGLERAKEVAFEWQQQRSRARWNEMVVLTQRGATSEWVQEIHGLIGVVGELLLVCVEAEVEKTILVRCLDELSTESTLKLSRRAALSRALRFFAEGQGNELTVAGHALANLTLRTLALHPRFDITPYAGTLNIDVPKFTARSLDRKSWTSFSADRAAAMVGVAQDTGAVELIRLAERLEDIAADQALQALHELRNQQYHRWRGESPGVTGVNFSDDSMLARLNRGEVVGFGHELLPTYREGQAVLDELVRVTRNALDALVAYLPGFLARWRGGFHTATSE